MDSPECPFFVLKTIYLMGFNIHLGREFIFFVGKVPVMFSVVQ